MFIYKEERNEVNNVFQLYLSVFKELNELIVLAIEIMNQTLLQVCPLASPFCNLAITCWIGMEASSHKWPNSSSSSSCNSKVH